MKTMVVRVIKAKAYDWYALHIGGEFLVYRFPKGFIVKSDYDAHGENNPCRGIMPKDCEVIKNKDFGEGFEKCPICGNKTMRSRDKECLIAACSQKHA